VAGGPLRYGNAIGNSKLCTNYYLLVRTGTSDPQGEAPPVSNGMERNAKFIAGLVIFILAALGIGAYTYLQSREFLRGPQITITSPQNGETFESALVVIEGTAHNATAISLNDGAIFADSKGNFKEKLLLLPGYNILTVKAEDRFGKRVEKTLELVYKEPQKVLTAGSTPAGM